ncbi:hypothetical protein [Ovoidimarina sediminis]|uniref:hypothetical protein n=1 Tax=Ovoidimarina sediminis TaxID=3079856 RepID=UPI0029310259|nr:hypothetical protein [Rhodophyticola sp. MJ-SS7]
MINRGLTETRQSAGVLQNRPGITMYEFRGATLQSAVHHALRHPALSTKKLAKVAAKFGFAARMRMGAVLFVCEGNLSFA